jgi:hypothetical protein
MSFLLSTTTFEYMKNVPRTGITGFDKTKPTKCSHNIRQHKNK